MPPFASLPVRRIGNGLVTVYALEPHPNRRRHLARSDRPGGSTQFLIHRPVPVFANARTSDQAASEAAYISKPPKHGRPDETPLGGPSVMLVQDQPRC